MSIRICWIIPTLDEGGAEKQLCMLAQGIDRTLFEPFVITLTRTGPRRTILDEARIPIIEIQKRGACDPIALWRLRKTLREIKPQIVHTWIFAANSYGRAVAWWLRVPVILGGERCVDPWKTTTHAMIDRFLAHRSAGIVTNSSGVVDFYCNRGIAESKFTVIPNAVSEPKSPAISREVACQRLGVDPNRFLIGTIGRLWPQKGHKAMIWAGEMVRVLHENTTLLVIGDGPERPRLEHYRDQVRAARQVRFLGHRSDVEQLVPHFDLYWNASHYEGQSNSILEAMQAGVPVIATDISGNRDLIEHDQTGLLFPVDDVGALMKLTSHLIESNEKRAKLASRARQIVAQKFSLERMIDEHERLYTKLVEQASNIKI